MWDVLHPDESETHSHEEHPGGSGHEWEEWEQEHQADHERKNEPYDTHTWDAHLPPDHIHNWEAMHPNENEHSVEDHEGGDTEHDWAQLHDDDHANNGISRRMKTKKENLFLKRKE